MCQLRRFATIITGLLVLLGATAPTATAASTMCWPSNHALDRSRAVLLTQRAEFTLVQIGDSTRDPSVTGPGIPAALVERLHLEGGQIVPLGKSGQTIGGLLTSGVLSQAAAANPDLVEVTIGINDWRVDQTIGGWFEEQLADLVQRIVETMPAADVMLSIPGAFAADDVNSNGYVIDRAGVVNPDGAAQAATEGIRAAFLAMRNRWPNVTVVDMQQAVTGTDVRPAAESGLLADQVHPSQTSYARQAAAIVDAFNVCSPTRTSVFGKRHLYPQHV